MAEHLVTAFRAIGAGGAITLQEPLVRYRRGGISRGVRSLHAAQVVQRVLKNNRHALVELPLMLADARRMGQANAVENVLGAELRRERFIHDVFAADALAGRLRALWQYRAVPWSLRLRMFTYAAIPGLLAPWFWLKRRVARRRQRSDTVHTP